MKALLLAAGVALAAAPAAAQAICRPFPVMKALLADQFKEHQAGVGMVNQGLVYVLFTSEEGKTWTLVSVNTSGKACMIGSGSSWTPSDLGA